MTYQNDIEKLGEQHLPLLSLRPPGRIADEEEAFVQWISGTVAPAMIFLNIKSDIYPCLDENDKLFVSVAVTPEQGNALQAYLVDGKPN